MLILHAVAAYVLEVVRPPAWVDPNAAMVLAVALVCMTHLPPPLGLAFDTLASNVLRLTPLLAAASFVLGALRLWVWHRSRGPHWDTHALVDGVSWCVAGMAHMCCACWGDAHANIATERFSRGLQPLDLEDARYERPRQPLVARVNPLLFPHRGFHVERIAVPGGATLDCWPVPEGAPPGGPVFFYIHGGAWRAGTSRINPSSLLIHRLSLRGWRVYAPNYRKRRWPEQLLDCRSALEFVLRQAGGASHVVLGGFSAGGHLAALLAAGLADEATDPSGQGRARGTPAVGGVVLVSPALDPADEMKQYLPFPGGRSTGNWFFERLVLRGDCSFWSQANPLEHVTERFPPCLIVHGEIDGLVPFVASDAFMSALSSARESERDLLVAVPGSKHNFEQRGGSLVAAVHDGIVAWLKPFEAARVDSAPPATGV